MNVFGQKLPVAKKPCASVASWKQFDFIMLTVSCQDSSYT